MQVGEKLIESYKIDGVESWERVSYLFCEISNITK